VKYVSEKKPVEFGNNYGIKILSVRIFNTQL